MILDFGKFKGRDLADVPDWYLKWLAERGDELRARNAAAVHQAVRAEHDRRWPDGNDDCDCGRCRGAEAAPDVQTARQREEADRRAEAYRAWQETENEIVRSLLAAGPCKRCGRQHVSSNGDADCRGRTERGYVWDRRLKRWVRGAEPEQHVPAAEQAEPDMAPDEFAAMMRRMCGPDGIAV